MDVKRYEANYVPYEGLDLSGACAEMHGRFFVHMEDFDRVTAERDALQLRLNAVDEENDRFRTLLYLAHPMTNDVAHDPDIYMEISEALEKRP